MAKKKVSMTLTISVNGTIAGFRSMDANEDLGKRAASQEELENALKAAAREIRAAFAKDQQ